MPIGTPISTPTISATTPSSMVVGSRPAISSPSGSLAESAAKLPLQILVDPQVLEEVSAVH